MLQLVMLELKEVINIIVEIQKHTVRDIKNLTFHSVKISYYDCRSMHVGEHLLKFHYE